MVDPHSISHGSWAEVRRETSGIHLAIRYFGGNDDDPYLDSDAVFGVRDSLVVPFVRNDSDEEARQFEVSVPFYTVDYDFVFEPPEARWIA